MKQIVAMIPARLDSKRIIKKNLRLIDGKPLISYVIEKVKNIDIFDDIYLNSESLVFKDIAKEHGIKFYRRDPRFSTDKSTNDEFALDFIESIKCDILIQILPTSPLILNTEIENFVSEMIKNDFSTFISVVHTQIASIYKNNEINFNKLKVNPPSQTMEPIKSYATVLMGWDTKTYINNMKDFGSAYHGGKGKTGYFELRGLSTIDIDREEDFILAEKIILAEKNKYIHKIEYYDEKKFEHSEKNVEKILKEDGVEKNDLYDVNKEKVNLNEILSSMDSSISWSKRIIDSESNSMTIISQLPGEGNRLHYHPNWNEWWYIIDGQWEWEIEGKIRLVKKGDIVFMPKNKKHKITATGDKPAIRMAVSRADVEHIYPDQN